MNKQELAKLSQNWLDIAIPFSYDYNKRYSVKELARLVNIPRRTVIRYLNLLDQPGMLKSETKGNTKIFYMDVKNEDSKIFINLVESYKAFSYRKIQEVWIILNELMRFGDIVLFGSYAKGYFNKESDIDLLILSKKSKKAMEQAKLYSIPVNVHFSTIHNFQNLLNKKNTLAIEIIKSHVVFGSGSFIELCWRYYRHE